MPGAPWLALVLLLASLPARAASLTWNAVIDREWNSTTANFSGATFASGDTVLFTNAGAGAVFLGLGGVAADVAPALTQIQTSSNYTFSGGALAAGALLKLGAGTATFSGTNSHAFPGGAVARGGTLEFSFATNSLALAFGAGPVVVDGATFRTRMVSAANNQTSRLANALFISSNGGLLSLGKGPGNPKMLLSGALEISNSVLRIEVDGGGGTGVAYHELSGDITLHGACGLVRTNNTGNTDLALTGSLRDGGAPGLLALRNTAGRRFRLLGTNNTWAGGTVIQTNSTPDNDFVNFSGAVDVNTNSSLGLGPVTVEAGAFLRLRGSRNIASNAAVDIQGVCYLETGVTCRVAQLTLGTNTFTRGLFNSNNAPAFLAGGGVFDLGSNQFPAVALTTPLPAETFVEGDVVKLSASASDGDGSITRVEFFSGTNLLGIVSASPFELYWPYVTPGAFTLLAVAQDDNQARATSAPVNITVTAPAPAALTWTGAENNHWDTRSTNWTGPRTVFHQGDAVLFATSPHTEILVQHDSTPFAVRPGAVTFGPGLPFAVAIRGGDIASGSVEHLGNGFIDFIPSTPLTFAGGATTRAGWLVLDTTALQTTNAAGLGTGPVILDSGYFRLRTSNTLQVLLNDIVVTTNGGNFDRHYVGAPFQPHPYRFAGAVEVGGYFRIGEYGNIGGPNHLDGSLRVAQAQPAGCVLDVRSYNGFFFNGPIQDGPGAAGNALRLINREIAPLTIANGSNTYAGGTVIRTAPFEPIWLTNNWGNVEVRPDSSLGLGPVTVESNAALRVLGAGNIAAGQSLNVQGYLYLTNGVKIRLGALTLGTNNFTTGLFHATNWPWLLGGGTLRLPATNLAPAIALTNPLPAQTFLAGDALPLRALVSDADSFITNVTFFVNGVPVGERTAAPFHWFHQNAAPGSYALHAVARDDDGGVTASAVVNVSVLPAPAPRELIWTNAVSREWNTEAANWSNALVFHAGDAARFTDAGAGGVFLGNSGVPLDTVFGDLVIATRSNYLFSGGNLVGTGALSGLTKSGPGTATFSNLAVSQPFAGPVSVTGGTLELIFASGAQTLGFGSGPVALNGGTLRFRPRATVNGQASTLLNDLGVTGTNATLSQGPSGNAKCVWAGTLTFGPDAKLNLVTDNGGGTGVDNHAVTGLVWLNGTNRLARHTGHGNAAFAFLGNVAEVVPSALWISNNTDRALRFGGPGNAWSRGTVMQNCGGTISNPSNTTYSVEVLAGSRLGLGDVLVESNGLLRMLGGGAISQGAKLDVQGFAYVPGKVTVKVSQLTLGAQTFTNGVFGFTNGGGRIFGGGVIAVNVSNTPPVATLALSRGNNTTNFSAGMSALLDLSGSDEDGFVTSLELLDGTNRLALLAGTARNFTWTNLPAGVHVLTVVATDNEGARTVSAPLVLDISGFDLPVSSATYLSGGTNYDSGEAVEIAPDQTVVWAGTLTGQALEVAAGVTATNLLGGGDGAVVRLNRFGTRVLSVTRLGAAIDDMDVNRSNGVIAVAGPFGVAVLSADAGTVLWSAPLTTTNLLGADENGRRVSIAPDGMVAALDNKNIRLFTAVGALLTNWNIGNHFVNDIVLHGESQTVLLCGFDNKTLPGDNACPFCPVQVAFLRAFAYDATQKWQNWAWPGGDLNGNEADSRAYRVTLGRDGMLYLAGESAGGNSIYRYNATNLTMSGNQVTFDGYNNAYNTGANHLTYYCRMDPLTGYVLKGQFALARLPNTYGNTIRPRSIAADESGFVYVGGVSAFQIQNRDLNRIGGFPVAIYSGGDPYLLVVRPDFMQRRAWTVFSGPAGATNPPGNGSWLRGVTAGNGLAAVTARATGQMLTTPNAIQPDDFSVTNSPDGYLAVFPAANVTNALGQGFDYWRGLNFTAGELDLFAVAGSASDPDGDGTVNFDEFLNGTDPRVPDTTLRLAAQLNGANIRLAFTAADNTAYTLLGSVSPAGEPWQVETNIGAAPGPRLVEIELPRGSSPRFFRVRRE
jgi:autotransporter-associated beta strand protein